MINEIAMLSYRANGDMGAVFSRRPTWCERIAIPPFRAAAHPPPGIMPTDGSQSYNVQYSPQHSDRVEHSTTAHPPIYGQPGFSPQILNVQPTAQASDAANQRAAYQTQAVPSGGSFSRDGIPHQRRGKDGLVGHVAPPVAIGISHIPNFARQVIVQTEIVAPSTQFRNHRVEPTTQETRHIFLRQRR